LGHRSMIDGIATTSNDKTHWEYGGHLGDDNRQFDNTTMFPNLIRTIVPIKCKSPMYMTTLEILAAVCKVTIQFEK